MGVWTQGKRRVEIQAVSAGHREPLAGAVRKAGHRCRHSPVLMGVGHPGADAGRAV